MREVGDGEANMMSVDEEIEWLTEMLSHSAEFDICIHRVIYIYRNSDHWEVLWQDNSEGMDCECQREFASLEEAVRCFVEKRRYLCVGNDFDQQSEK
jgi:hypothetical protein